MSQKRAIHIANIYKQVKGLETVIVDQSALLEI
jgi:hypothetical protein